MKMEDVVKTAHIHLEVSTYRVHVDDSSLVNVKMMQQDENKPDFVNGVARSNDNTQNRTSILVETCGDVDMIKLADWVNSYL